MKGGGGGGGGGHLNNQSHEQSSMVSIGVGTIIGTQFRLQEKLGQGSFGTIFKCTNIETHDSVAVKLQQRSIRSSMLIREIKVLMEMKDEKGFAKMFQYGKDEQYNYVVMSYLGRNLDSLLRKCSGKFTIPCVMSVAEQMITRLQMLHFRNLIHRDIKPENFVIGQGSNFTTVYLIDFGLAKFYRDNDGTHIPFIEKKGMIGTARYASINAHHGYEQSRRDDLEALGYVLIYFFRGRLPWQNIYSQTKEDQYQKIKNMKMSFDLEKLCENCPQEMIQYFKHVKALNFTEAPNYAFLRQLFQKATTTTTSGEKSGNSNSSGGTSSNFNSHINSPLSTDGKSDAVKITQSPPTQSPGPVSGQLYDWEILNQFSRHQQRYKTHVVQNEPQNNLINIAASKLDNSPQNNQQNGLLSNNNNFQGSNNLSMGENLGQVKAIAVNNKTGMDIKLTQLKSHEVIGMIKQENVSLNMVEQSPNMKPLPNGNFLMAPVLGTRELSSASASGHTQDTSKYNNYDWTHDDESSHVVADQDDSKHKQFKKSPNSDINMREMKKQLSLNAQGREGLNNYKVSNFAHNFKDSSSPFNTEEKRSVDQIQNIINYSNNNNSGFLEESKSNQIQSLTGSDEDCTQLAPHSTRDQFDDYDVLEEYNEKPDLNSKINVLCKQSILKQN